MGISSSTVAAYEAATTRGEGLYPSQIAEWRKMRDEGVLAGKEAGSRVGRLTVVHADRGTAMTSKTVATLLADLHVTRSHSRVRVYNDNPYSQGVVSDDEILTRLPRTLRQSRGGAGVSARFRGRLQPQPPADGYRLKHTC